MVSRPSRSSPIWALSRAIRTPSGTWAGSPLGNPGILLGWRPESFEREFEEEEAWRSGFKKVKVGCLLCLPCLFSLTWSTISTPNRTFSFLFLFLFFLFFFPFGGLDSWGTGCPFPVFSRPKLWFELRTWCKNQTDEYQIWYCVVEKFDKR